MYNVYRDSFANRNATVDTKRYVGDTGWICKVAGDHGVNPKTGNNFRTDIASTISSARIRPSARRVQSAAV